MIKTYDVEKDNYEAAGQASRDIKKTLKMFGLDSAVLKRIAIACYEAEINIVIHSNGGKITFELMNDGSVNLSFDDTGPGITDLEKAMTPGYSTASTRARELGFGAGMGLVNMKSVASTFNIESNSEGTHIKMSFK